MKDGLTQVKELKDKIHEQYIEIQELNKARKIDIEYNKYLQKEIIRLNNIINRTTKYVQSLSSKGRGCDIYEDIKQEILKELKGVNKE